MHIHIINGPNLNLLGIREKNVYGQTTFDDFFNRMCHNFKDVNLTFFQSNIEGELIDNLHKTGFTVDGIILNGGGYTHTSIALADAITAISTPVIEVHISNIFAREDYRKVSLLASKCIGSISGFGLNSYRLAIEAFLVAKTSNY